MKGFSFFFNHQNLHFIFFLEFLAFLFLKKKKGNFWKFWVFKNVNLAKFFFFLNFEYQKNGSPKKKTLTRSVKKIVKNQQIPIFGSQNV